MRLLLPVPPVFIDGALNVAQNFFLVLLQLIDIGCCFLGTKYLPGGKREGTINAILRITRAANNDLFLKLPMCFRKKWGYETHLIIIAGNKIYFTL